MRRRLTPILFALALGMLALGWGLASLHGIFEQERAESLEQLRTRQAALEGVATSILTEGLRSRARESLPELQRVLADPLLPSDTFLLAFRGRFFLPRSHSALKGPKSPGQDSYRDLLEDVAEGHSDALAWRARVGLLVQLESLLKVHDAKRAPGALDQLLDPNLRPDLSAAQVLSFLVVVLERLAPERAQLPLLDVVMEHGFPEDLGGSGRSVGLQRDLILREGALTQADFEFFRAHVLELSRTYGIDSRVFQARATEVATGTLVLPLHLDAPALLGERWVVEAVGEVVRGIAVNLPVELGAVEPTLRRRGLLHGSVRVGLARHPSLTPLTSLAVEVELPDLVAAERAIARRHALKALLLWACAGFALGVAALALFGQQRKARYLTLQSDFVSTVSHELRTPVASVRLLAETLERRVGHLPEARDYPQRLVRVADGLHFLTENILSFHRLDKGRWQPRRQPLRLGECLTGLDSGLSEVTRAPVQLETSVEAVTLDADPSLLKLLFANLARNACLYNLRTPVTIEIRAQTTRARAWTVLFTDNGIGIPEHHWERVFDDFWRLHPVGITAHGSGLGLSLCRKIMRLHGGDISILTSSAEGTTFALSFPAERA